METNTSLWLILGFAGLFALLRAMVDRVRRRFWKQAVRVVSSALWGFMGALLVREWLEVSPRTLWVVAALLGWVGYDATVGMMVRLLERQGRVKLDISETGQKGLEPKRRGTSGEGEGQ